MSEDPKCRCGAYARPELSDPRPDGIGGPLCSGCYDSLPWDEINHPELFGKPSQRRYVLNDNEEVW